MTDYPNKHAWRRRDAQRRGRELLSVFIVIVLGLAILNGLVKTVSFKKYLGKSNWDGKASFVAALGTDSPAILVFQQDPKRIALFKLDGQKYYFSGDSQEPLVKLSKVIDDKNASELTKVLSISAGADIESYMLFQNKKLDRQTVDESFKSFASIAMPFKIISGKTGGSVMSTNLSQKDLLLLWWQAKSLSANNLEIVDLTNLDEEIVLDKDRKVLGVDAESLHFRIAPYLENAALQDVRVLIENSSGSAASSYLAEEFVSGVGFVVTTINSGGNMVDVTKIVASDGDQYAVKYLAKIFDCDIVVAPKEAETDAIMVVLGGDFFDRYFK